MGVYSTRIVDEKFYSFIKRLDGSDILTVDAFVLELSQHLLSCVGCNFLIFDEPGLELVVGYIKSTPWLQEKEILVKAIKELFILPKDELFIKLANHFFDNQYYALALNFYNMVKDKDMSNCRFNTSMALIKSGFIKEGLLLLKELEDKKPYAKMYRLRIETQLSLEDHLEMLESMVASIEKPDNEQLGFLVWYYDYIGEYESSITSYLSINDDRLALHYINYYISYMLKSNQEGPMMNHINAKFNSESLGVRLMLIEGYMGFGDFDKGLDLVHNTQEVYYDSPELYIQESRCFLALSRVIQSIEAINKVDSKTLNSEWFNTYYWQLLKLSKLSNNSAKEKECIRLNLNQWRKEYRKIYNSILKYRNWKVDYERIF